MYHCPRALDAAREKAHDLERDGRPRNVRDLEAAAIVLLVVDALLPERILPAERPLGASEEGVRFALLYTAFRAARIIFDFPTKSVEVSFGGGGWSRLDLRELLGEAVLAELEAAYARFYPLHDVLWWEHS